jgi:hypothetical protein
MGNCFGYKEKMKVETQAESNIDCAAGMVWQAADYRTATAC